jgi:hypothetical protein
MDALNSKGVFDKYSYLAHKLETSNPNVALGLTYCKYVTGILGDEIKINSNKNTEETTFSFFAKNLKSK